jgi:hypothetical protein
LPALPVRALRFWKMGITALRDEGGCVGCPLAKVMAKSW